MAISSAVQMTRPSSVLSSAPSNNKSSEDDNNSHRSASTTPPTSYNESDSVSSQKTMDKLDTMRSVRKRKSVNYNETAMSAQNRNASGLTGKTLVHDGEDADEDSRPYKKRRATESFPDELPERQPRATLKGRMKKIAGKISSVLGKRKAEEPKTKALKELDMGTGGLLDEIDLDAYETTSSMRPVKKLKRSSTAVVVTETIIKIPQSKSTQRTKKWLTAGLYVGQVQNDKAAQAHKKLQKKSKDAIAPKVEKPPVMPLPMFGYLDRTRGFKIPFDTFAPTFKKGDDRPKDWHQLNRNRLIGEAKDIWEIEMPMAVSLCTCRRPAPGERGCGEDCINRVMHYECDEDNCALTAADCGNRAFADLAERTRKGGPFNVGVEVVKTPNRGFGVRACRVFAPGAIIMEYTGEIISEAECQRRMREVYSGKQSYYIMEFDQGLHIDGTKGSMARFVNHSCEPNCEVRMVKVGGKPRMAIFAGENGIFTGEELTYDYNFDNFSDNKQACYCGAPSCRGVLARRLNATEQKQKDKEDKEKQRLAEIEAQRAAVREEKKKTIKAERGPGWRGWVQVADVKDQLKQERAARQDAEKHSARAQRRAARDAGIVREPELPKPARRRTKTMPKEEPTDEIQVVATASAIGTSRFSEDLPRGDQIDMKKKTEVIVTTSISETIVVKDTELVEEDFTALPAMPQPREPIASSKSVVKPVKEVVKNGLKQGKSKIMRQSLLSFGESA